MQLDWNSFTPWVSLAGGLTIGLAAGLYVLGVGRIAGMVVFARPRARALGLAAGGAVAGEIGRAHV